LPIDGATEMLVHERIETVLELGVGVDRLLAIGRHLL
jgi:hypothetical protein